MTPVNRRVRHLSTRNIFNPNNRKQRLLTVTTNRSSVINSSRIVLNLSNKLSVMTSRTTTTPHNNRQANVKVNRQSLTVQQNHSLNFRNLRPSRLLTRPLSLLLRTFQSHLNNLTFLTIDNIRITRMTNSILNRLLRPLLRLINHRILVTNISHLRLTAISNSRNHTRRTSLPT